MTEQFLMPLHALRPRLLVAGIAFQHAIFGDEAAFDLAEPEFAPKLGLVGRRLAPADNRGVRLKQTDQFLGGGYLLMLQHPPRGLGDDLLHYRQIMRQRLCQSLVFFQGSQHDRRLTTTDENWVYSQNTADTEVVLSWCHEPAR